MARGDCLNAWAALLASVWLSHASVVLSLRCNMAGGAVALRPDGVAVASP